MGNFTGEYYRGHKGDARSLDYTSLGESGARSKQVNDG